MDINARVATNLRSLRENKKLSLEQTAKLTGVSKSMLGQIERNEVAPTITLLWKIAKGLKTSFTSLIGTEASDTSVVRLDELAPLAEDCGRFVNYPIFPFSESHPFEIYRITVKPLGTLRADAHLPDSEELITVFSGRVNITVDKTEYGLSTGDSIRFKADVPHAYSNPGPDEAELSMLIYYPQPAKPQG